MSKKSEFNDFRFADLDYHKISNKYFSMKRVSADKNKIVVKVADSHLIPTKFGYALILDRTHVVFLKDWQVNKNFYGNEVLLNKDFFNVKEWGEHQDFSDEDEALMYEYWLKVAQEQDDAVDEDGLKINIVKWKYAD